MSTRQISKNDDVIDSRDVEARIEELQGMIGEANTDRHDLLEAMWEAWDEWTEDSGNVDEDGEPLPFPDQGELDRLDRLADEEWLEERGLGEEAEELAFLAELKEEAEGCSPDWIYGSAMIADGYFEEYARQFAEDAGAISGAAWPYNCIDWGMAADVLKQDYSCVSAGGKEWWVR